MVSLEYNSSWDTPVLHYCADGGTWGDLPLTRTERHFWFHVDIPACPVTFVFTDGRGKWDNPSPVCRFTSQRNYRITAPGRYVVYRGEVLAVDPTAPRLLLITDLDGTLVQEHNAEADAASSRFARFWLCRHYFNGSKLVYSSGRSLMELEELRRSRVELLDPDLFIGEVGSDAYSMRSDTGEFELRLDYREAFPAADWDTAVVSRTLEARFPWLIHPRSFGNSRLTTYHIVRVEDLAAHEAELRSFLAERSEVRCLLHVSGSGSHRYLDFTSQHGGKRAGLAFCQQVFGFTETDTIVAGDSGNDLGMLKGPQRGVIPANRQAEVDRWLAKKERRNKFVSQLKFADAIIEALSHS